MLEKHVARPVRDFLRAHGWRIVRTEFVFVPGARSTGEPGMPDDIALYYLKGGQAYVLWLEYKGPNDQRTCRCRPGDKNPCKVCRQKKWHADEKARGGRVVQIDDADWFFSEYERAYGFLHRDRPAPSVQMAFAEDPL